MTKKCIFCNKNDTVPNHSIMGCESCVECAESSMNGIPKQFIDTFIKELA